VNEDCLKLTGYFGERDRADGAFLADSFVEIFARHELQTSLVMRGVTGFGLKHRPRTDRLLTLSEDLPLVAVAVDSRQRIERALQEVGELRFDGLVTLERASMLAGRLETSPIPRDAEAFTKLTVYLGRYQRTAGELLYEAVVRLLHQRGVAGATVLLGVDGTVRGRRQRASFLGRNTMVPLMVISVGESECIGEVLPELCEMLPSPLVTLERLTLCKRDGILLSRLPELPDKDPAGLRVWQKLMVYSSEQSHYDGEPLHQRLVRELRTAGAAGATSLRGIWGYHGDHQPHGDSFWQLRRRVPILTVLVDIPSRMRDWFSIVDRLTTETGLVTSETVPAFRATGPDLERGGFRLAQRLQMPPRDH
jgi:PII-like signaling protein